jgi:hypothetical protein
VFLLVRCSWTGWLFLDPHFLFFVWVWNGCLFQVLHSVSSGKLLFVVVVLKIVMGFWRLWLDSHGLWVISYDFDGRLGRRKESFDFWVLN